MKSLKRIVCVFLAVILLFGSTQALAASAEAAPWVDHNVQVYIEGFESKWVYYPEDPDTSLLFPIDGDRMSSEIGKLGDNLTADIKSLNPDTVYNIWYRTIWNLFGDTRLEPDGVTMQPNVTVDETTLKKKNDGRFIFEYDTRLDPVDVCDSLYEYLHWVYADEDAATMRDEDGFLNIEFIGSSYGASVLLAFISEYGYGFNEDDLKIKYDSVLFCVPTIAGVDFVSEIFTGNFNIDADALDAYISTMDLSDDINLVIDVLDKTGVLDALLALVVEPAMKVALHRSLHDSIVDIFGTFPSFWSFISADKFEEALDYVYNTDELREKYSVLIEKVRYYNDNIKVNYEKIITDAVAAGVDVNVVCKYAIAYFPLVEAGNVQGDGFVVLERASLGATCAMNEETLPDNYVQQKYPNIDYISADNCIDASTCLLPENTWFIRNLGHGIKPDIYYDTIEKIVYDDLDINSDPDYPQFLYYDEDAKTISPLASANLEIVEEPNVFETLVAFMKMLWNLFIGLFNK